tara:strand:+ start:925 stop:1968 length:1044 start_codon:yes stop_codon:yes gene_type:complete
MATSYPTSLDTSGGTLRTDISSTDDLDSSGKEHDVMHVNVHGAAIALETKIGTGSSTPVADAVLMGTGTGTSAWDTSPTFKGAVTVGVDGTGHDVKLFGTTSGVYSLWDQSADEWTFVGADLDMDDNAVIRLGTGDDLLVYSNGSNSFIDHNGDGDLWVRALGTGEELYLEADDNLILRTGSTAANRLTINSTGLLTSPRSYSATTGNAANLYVDTDGSFYRSTAGSIRLKTDVEDAGDSYADAVLDLRPIWFRSLATADRRDWSHWGLIAEEVAEIDPRLVHWGWVPVENNDGEQVVNEDGDPVWELDADGEKVLRPDGVQYTRIVPLLINLIKRQDARIAALEAA